MPIYVNNCRGRDHVTYFGPDAFFDLNITGKQAEMAKNLQPGTECIVASYSANNNAHVVFRWYIFSHESIDSDPHTPDTQVRVFRGTESKLKRKRISKLQAAKMKPYSAFFNVLGHFKRPSVIP